jgi:hypothetical protein
LLFGQKNFENLKLLLLFFAGSFVAVVPYLPPFEIT